MKVFTLRNIPHLLAKRIEEEAARTRSSLNATMLRLLAEATGTSPHSERRKRRRDLSHLVGTWSEEEAREFDRFLAEHRKIDAELWK